MKREERISLYNKMLMAVNNAVREHKGQEFSHVSAMKFIDDKLTNSSAHQVENKSPEESWKEWKEARYADGWTYGEYDQDKKTHPNLVEKYEELDKLERFKDVIAQRMLLLFFRGEDYLK